MFAFMQYERDWWQGLIHQALHGKFASVTNRVHIA